MTAKRLVDDPWNNAMTRLLREAAEVREANERARSIQDGLAARQEADALLELIRAHPRPAAQHDVSRPTVRRSHERSTGFR